jgi:hypothetical protein
MTFEELKQCKSGIFENKKIVESDFENISKSKMFSMPGVYVLVEKETQEVVYIGSAYARNLRERLLQYTRKGSGNTLKKDLIHINKTTSDGFGDYLKTLKIYAFEEFSSEYELLDTAGLIVANKAGTKKNKKGKKK